MIAFTLPGAAEQITAGHKRRILVTVNGRVHFYVSIFANCFPKYNFPAEESNHLQWQKHNKKYAATNVIARIFRTATRG